MVPRSYSVSRRASGTTMKIFARLGGAGFSLRGTLVPPSRWRTEVRRRLKKSAPPRNFLCGHGTSGIRTPNLAKSNIVGRDDVKATGKPALRWSQEYFRSVGPADERAPLVLRRPFHMIDRQHIHPSLASLKFQPKLLLQGGEYGSAAIRESILGSIVQVDIVEAI